MSYFLWNDEEKKEIEANVSYKSNIFSYGIFKKMIVQLLSVQNIEAPKNYIFCTDL